MVCIYIIVSIEFLCKVYLLNPFHSVLEYKAGMAKAYGNLGNTLKIIGRFDEAVTCGKRHLIISREIKDRVRSCLSFPRINVRVMLKYIDLIT